jgi:hypothetical protein
MSRRQTSTGQTAEATPPIPELVSDRSLWICRSEVARRLGISFDCVPRVVHASGVRVKRFPGLNRVSYYLPDVDRLATEAFTNLPQPNRKTARKTG